MTEYCIILGKTNTNRCLPILLAAVLQLQHHGRHVRQVQERLPPGSDGLHAYHLAGLHQQLRQSGHLHDIQSRVPQGLQEDHAHGVIENAPWQTREQCGSKDTYGSTEQCAKNASNPRSTKIPTRHSIRHLGFVLNYLSFISTFVGCFSSIKYVCLAILCK